VGTLDELSAAMGLVRAHPDCPRNIAEMLKTVQSELIDLAPGLMADTQDRDRYNTSDRIKKLGSNEVYRLEREIEILEAQGKKFRGFVLPGDNEISARLHMARTIARRAESSLSAIREAGLVVPPVAFTYLNRLSDVLWLQAMSLTPREED
jgi:cob(I)alamin adenosyltransferase